jgi:hypothetical protein
MREQLISWQWSLYPDGHRDHRNLLIHIVTVPLFLFGCVCLPCTPWNWRVGVLGVACMFVALFAQGRGHKLESTAPVAFEGPIDVVSRFFAEQWITFPRYVLTGGWWAAWRRRSAP